MNQEDDYGKEEFRTMTATRTPGKLYVLRQRFPSLAWQVVPVDEAQGRAMRKRGEKHVYDSAAQAHAVLSRMRVAVDVTTSESQGETHVHVHLPEPPPDAAREAREFKTITGIVGLDPGSDVPRLTLETEEPAPEGFVDLLRNTPEFTLNFEPMQTRPDLGSFCLTRTSEIDRLRGLIRAATAAQSVIGDMSGGEFLCPLCGNNKLDFAQPGGLAHTSECPWPALVEEASKP